MNWLDFLLAGILLLSTVAGFVKGFFRLGIGLAATFLAFLLSAWFYEEAGNWAIPYTSSRGIANFVGFMLIFLSVTIAGSLLGRLMAHVFKWIGLSWLDRAGGGALGLIRGGLVSLVIVLMISAFLPGNPPSAIVHSRMAAHFIEGARVLSLTTSPEMKQRFRQTYDKTRQAWMDPVRKQFEKIDQ